MAIASWAGANSSSHTKRVAMDLMEKREKTRLEKQCRQLRRLPKKSKK
jgi:hypothetical protein